ncbi:MAG: hypothetical protein MHMPM18_002887 [Marteilia pararefringens]
MKRSIDDNIGLDDRVKLLENITIELTKFIYKNRKIQNMTTVRSYEIPKGSEGIVRLKFDNCYYVCFDRLE